MASVFTHVFLGIAQGVAGKATWKKQRRFWLLAVLCSILPDFDGIGLKLGVPYGVLWGHRGMTHSLLFALIAGIAAAACFPQQPWREKEKWKLAFLFFIITASHGVLDAMTDGGLGVAFFSPFNPHRYFFPWRPIHVSPMSAPAFFTPRGLRVMWSELIWVWCPTLVAAAFVYCWRVLRRSSQSETSEPTHKSQTINS
jgi:inner membrane protein